MTEYITVQEVREITFVLARKRLLYDQPIPDFNTRDPGKLESCLYSPFQTFGGKDLYPNLISKASILFYLMNKNHPFKNGNKRVAMITLLYFLDKHDFWLDVDHEELYILAVWVAGSPSNAKKETVQYIEKFIKKYIK